MNRPLYPRTGVLAGVTLMFGLASADLIAQHSVARQWNELLLESIRHDFPRPTVHARNLFHISAAMWDAWATFDQVADCVIFHESHPTTSPAIHAMREEAISYAAYTLLKHRFGSSPGAALMLPQYDALQTALGYSTTNTSTTGNSPAAIGNRCAAAVLQFGAGDHSNEANGFANQVYQPINPPLLPEFPGNPTMLFPNRWQPLALQYFIGQNGIPVPTGYPPFLSPEWGRVTPFALSQTSLSVHQRAGYDWWVYHDPGTPPMLGQANAANYKWGFEMVAAWSSHLDPSDGVMIDVSPASIGNASLPAGPSQYSSFYDFTNGGDWGHGRPVNPVTGQPYVPQMVPRGDYTRVLAEFWADGPNSETPPGHWFTILNYVSDHPLTQKRIGGVGPVVDDLEWDVKAYMALGGAMHDCAVSAWGVKGLYDYVRPVSAIRYMADRYEVNPNDPDAITLVPGLIEEITPATTAPGQRHEHLAGNEGKVALYAWRGPEYIQNPATDVAGVGWILAAKWWPYQRPTFVSPPFAGYVSGHSTYSRAAAVVMHRLTGSAYFPGGLGEFVCPQNQFLVFEDGPSVTVTLQWASYYDASDQCSLSRIWGGIHPPQDDIPGRKMGQTIGNDAFDYATMVWSGVPVPHATYETFGTGCTGSNGLSVTVSAVPSALPVIGSTMKVDVANLPAAVPLFVMLAGTTRLVPGFNLGYFGAPGCTSDVLPITSETLLATWGTGRWTLPIPLNTAWLGLSIYHQAVGIDLAANALGVTTSNLGDARLGL
ncbi:MAG TPA: vanadium-dependent haloperoxidase [Planctomycetota bacterium]|nr:vanadium-dependent haloperoxidase [Planctomycetota bacterium]